MLNSVLPMLRPLALAAGLFAAMPAAAQSIADRIVGSGDSAELRAQADGRGVLPTPAGRGRPYRQIKNGSCEGALCILRFNTVPANRLLEIQKLTCLALRPATYDYVYGVLSTSADLNETSKYLALIAPEENREGVYLISDIGPYYIGAEERPYLLVDGENGSEAICTISGLLYNVGS